MPTIGEITHEIEQFAPISYQEDYDNAKLLTGNKDWTCSGVLLTLDVIEEVVDEAISKQCNLIVAHHPVIFKGLKSLTGKNDVERTIIKAIKNDISIYAAHTNLDNVEKGVNAKIAEKLGLINLEILAPKTNTLLQLVTFVPHKQADSVREALFSAGAGKIGNYSKCSFNLKGKGTFLGNEDSDPNVGEQGKLQIEPETRIEVLVSSHLSSTILTALRQAHPYEEVAYYLLPLANENQTLGSGMIGVLPEEKSENEFLQFVKKQMQTPLIRHTHLLNKPIKKVALCGGAGSFLLETAKAKQADVFITGDMKYHEFFGADQEILIADIGHFESEQFTTELFHDIITKKFPTFAVHFSTIETNPINYY